MNYSDLTSYYNQIELEDDLKKYLGLPPYNTFTNPVVYDIYYLNSMYIKYGKELVTEAINRISKQNKQEKC